MGSAMVCALALGADGVLFSAGYDKTIIAWDGNGKQLYTLVGHTGSIRALALTPDGKHLYSGDRKAALHIGWPHRFDPRAGADARRQAPLLRRSESGSTHWLATPVRSARWR